MKKCDMLYEGKAKKVYATEDPELYIVDYKDDATAFNGLKKGTILGKGAINNRVTNHLMKMLETKGIPTHFVEELSDRETVVKKVHIVPLEVIIRNIAAGSMSKRLGIPEGKVLPVTVLEYSYKNDDLGDPLINDYHALAMELCTREELDQIASYAFKINDILKGMSLEKRLELPALTAGRADIITQGLDIALTVMQALDTPALTVSTTDLLLGQLLELIQA